MGVGVDAPGRDHHSTASPTEQGLNMTNGYNSDDQRGNTGGTYQGQNHPHNRGKTTMVPNPNSASAASTHSPAEPEEKSTIPESGMKVQGIDHIQENGLQKHENTTSPELNSVPSNRINLANNSLTKVEDCNSSRESIDVETTQPEDIKPFPSFNSTTLPGKITEPLDTGKTSSEVPAVTQSAIKQEVGSPPTVDWRLYHLGEMTLETWLQAIRKHVLMPLIRHPKSEAFRRPVDPAALGIFPVYNQIIIHPMDLGTVKDKIEKGVYVNKSSCLQDVNQVWLNAKKFNPCTHVVHQSAELLQNQMFDMLGNLVKSGGATGRKSLPVAIPIPPPMRNVGIREARKRPVGLPGEYDDVKPQHLEQKYASKLSEPLKQCDAIMRNLMLQSQHWDYVEPFMKPVTAGKGQSVRMSFALINERLRNYYYSNALEFATDVRRIVTETYRAANEPIEEDFRAQKARILHKEFEYQFARVKDDEETETGGMSKIAVMQDPYISKLMKAQELLSSISKGVTSLTDDVVAFMEKKRERRKEKMLRRQSIAAINSHSVIDAHSGQPPPNKRQRNAPNIDHIDMKLLGGKQPVKDISTVNVPSASPEQIGEWIQSLDAAGQEHLLEILKRNGEPIEVDEEGEVELSLENWSNKTLKDVEIYLRQKLNHPVHPIRKTPNRPIVQNLPNPKPCNQPQATLPQPQISSHVSNTNLQKPVTNMSAFDRNPTGGKHISQTDCPKDVMGSDQDGSDSSSDSSDSSEDESSSSGDSSDENE